MEADKEMLNKSIEAASPQWDADDFVSGPKDFTIKSVKKGTSEQPIFVMLEDSVKYYAPSKTFRRALIFCFTDDASNWVGKRIRLFRNPETLFGNVKVGGIEISHASIDAPIVLMLASRRGKKVAIKIDVLPTQKASPKAKAAPAPVAAPEPKPQDKPHARGTISGDVDEGNLDGHLPPSHPAKDDMDKMLAAFAKIGMDSAAVEREYNKPIKDWSMEDFTEAREVFKECKADWELKQAAEATQDLI